MEIGSGVVLPIRACCRLGIADPRVLPVVACKAHPSDYAARSAISHRPLAWPPLVVVGLRPRAERTPHPVSEPESPAVPDGVDVLEQLVTSGSLTGVRVFFPDPWPKARHHKRRLLQPETVAY